MKTLEMTIAAALVAASTAAAGKKLTEAQAAAAINPWYGLFNPHGELGERYGPAASEVAGHLAATPPSSLSPFF
jgi:hypothetical protein